GPRGGIPVEEGNRFLRPLVKAAALAAGGGEDALGELVIGHVLLEPGADPGLEARRVGFLGDGIGIDAEIARLEEIAELEGPQRGMAGPGEELGDFLLTLIGMS